MLSLILLLLLLSSFDLLVKRGTMLRMDMLTIGTLNFPIAGLVAILFWSSQIDSEFIWTTIGLGMVMGFLYFSSYFLVLYSIRNQGVAATRAVIQLNLIMPLGFSVFWWGEHPNVTQNLGLALALGSLFLLDARRDLGGGKRISLRWRMAGIVFLTGMGRITAKAFTEMDMPEQAPFFYIAMFTTAGFGAMLKLLWEKPSISPRKFSFGSILALINVFHVFFLIQSLQQLPGIIVFPTAACGALAFTTLIATLMLSERPTTRQYCGMATSSIAVVLFSLADSFG